MTRWQRLRSRETGNVLYMTIVLMMLLTAFTLVLVNVTYIAVMKVRAQNLADNLALSVAVKKARVLNKITEINNLIEFGALEMTVKRYVAYYPLDIALYVAGVGLNTYIEAKIIPDYNAEIAGDIDRMCDENQVDTNTCKIGIDSYTINRLSDITSEFTKLTYVNPYPEATIPLFMMTKYEPANAWCVQSRVEQQTKKNLIGGERLGFELPDIVARGRANVIDMKTGSKSEMVGSVLVPPWCNHRWGVQLAQPDDGIDQKIKKQMH